MPRLLVPAGLLVRHQDQRRFAPDCLPDPKVLLSQLKGPRSQMAIAWNGWRCPACQDCSLGLPVAILQAKPLLVRRKPDAGNARMLLSNVSPCKLEVTAIGKLAN